MTLHARHRGFFRLIAPVLGVWLFVCASVPAQINRGLPEEMRGLEVEQKLGDQIPLDANFVDERGRNVTLADYFKGERPVVLVLNYFRCPSLCGLLLNHLTDRMKEMNAISNWLPGTQFDVLAVSFEPLEGPQFAAAKKRSYVLELGKSEAEQGLHFLTGEKADIDRLRHAVGYPIRWNSERQEWIHPSAIMVCTPNGVISRYLSGLDYDAQTLRLSLVEASQGKTGSVWDKVFLTCYVYYSHEGRYVPYAMGIMRVGGAVTVLLLGGFVLILRRMEAARRRAAGISGGLTGGDAPHAPHPEGK
ncbi:MAG: SCO family protein [Planctomycetes bacterium]|nr:SCO family protein [Planctomycetota bacterium]